MGVFSAVSFDEHEQVVFGHDRDSGLRAIIAVHDTTLGPAVGGCRMYPYASEEAAVEDVLRLSRGMTYKSALAGLPLGGGKSVIIGDPATHKTRPLMLAMGRFVDSLGGRYVAAEDSGTSVDDLRVMGETTAHVSGIATTEHGGDPSPSTALGVFLSIRRALAHRLGCDDLRGVRVAIQGLGHVGFDLARRLVTAGAEVRAADMSAQRLERAERELGVQPMPIDEVMGADVDVLAPCALGGVLNRESIPAIRAGIVAGAANNQLRHDSDADRLADRGILYCPDFLINAGGIIDVHYQRSDGDRRNLEAHIAGIANRLDEVMQRSDNSHRSTAVIAEELARELLARQAKAPSQARIAA